MLQRMMVVAAAMIVSATAVTAQPPGGGGPGGMQARRMEAMMKGITLSADQQKKVDSIQTASRAEMPAMTPGSPPDPEMRQKMMEASRKRDDAIRGVLTTEQQAIWDKNAEEVRGMMRRPPG
jgi:Spy/CpxP family protein refolding chaperone